MSNIDMKTMNIIFSALLGLSPLAGICGTATADFANPEDFTDFSVSGMSEEKTLNIFEGELEQELERIADKYLAEGETLTLVFTDIDMAGDIQPWRNRTNSDIRYVEAIYPPRLQFSYSLADADGNILKEGEAIESDLGFQMNISASVRGKNMSFFYELELLSDWARKELGHKDVDSSGD
ncbi:DUF3016 domain-containing protein [Puniceicoccales bacterium CK1056]|uniref:DUF3016 domain-containing protein n=1 Tax=Oceanipulchritudo coccoides TaxID=2706888 RepID=A0A6B2M2V4_9BACT|nr:DUF3016 domain-containing protein [Oceanipulchritudo coccoides]NDV62030.1 DUF3016 domain-containing protein [Oceanipulchritudo coccoides]